MTSDLVRSSFLPNVSLHTLVLCLPNHRSCLGASWSMKCRFFLKKDGEREVKEVLPYQHTHTVLQMKGTASGATLPIPSTLSSTT